MCTTPSRVVKRHVIFFKTLFKNEVKYASLSGESSLFSASSEKSVEKQKSERKQRKFVCEAPPPTGENKHDNLTDRSSL